MFRAFIADDDTFAVEATYKMFPWEELNVTAVEKIYSPIGLAEKIMTEKPEIVFIDIEMGSVSGLDVMRRCKEEKSDAVFVIISGHDNFDYAHTAMNLGAIYYLLKPIDFADVKNVTKKLKQALLKHDGNEISDHLLSKDSLERFFAVRLFDRSYRFMIALMTDAAYTHMQTALQGIVQHTYKIGEDKYLFVLQDEAFTPEVQNKITQYAKAQQFVLGVSTAFVRGGHIYDSFCQANLLAYQCFICRSGGLLFWPADTDTTLLAKVLDEIFKAVDTKNSTWIEKILERLPHLFIENRYTMHHVVWFYNALIGKINIALNREFPFPHMDEEDLQMYFRNFKELCASLQAYIKDTIEPKEPVGENTHNLWTSILDYIEKNYAKKLRAQDICADLYISSTTLYNAFKSNTNKTFVEYLTCFRLEKAKQLLLISSQTIPEIAESVGIKDHYYFNKVFKKYTDMSPIKFRTQGKDEQHNAPTEN